MKGELTLFQLDPQDTARDLFLTSPEGIDVSLDSRCELFFGWGF